MPEYAIQKIFSQSYASFCRSGGTATGVQRKAANAIINCKTGVFGCSVSICDDCGHTETHYNSCRNRNCPICQAVSKERWVDARRAEVIDTPYFHVVFTLPHELNPLLYCNQKELYGLFHKCCSQTLLELSASPKYLGATPGIIQVLHTWDQEMKYHVHMHCIISGGGLTADRKIRKASPKFFIPVRVLRDKFRGKFLAMLDRLYAKGSLVFSESCRDLSDPHAWKSLKDRLYRKDWCPYIKETFNGFGNAIEYLGKYTHRIVISNARIVSYDDKEVTFSARGKRPGDPRRNITVSCEEFIRRFLMHTLPERFQKIRYYGYLNNRMRSKNMRLIFDLQGHQRFKAKYAGMTTTELLKKAWGIDVCRCPVCGGQNMHPLGTEKQDARDG